MKPGVLSKRLFRQEYLMLSLVTSYSNCICIRCRSVTILGTIYKRNKCCMMTGVMNLPTGSAPKFGILYDILVYGKEPKILFIFSLLETLGFNSKLGAYAVHPLTGYFCVYPSALPCHYRFSIIDLNGHQYIKSKYDLTVYCNY